jgi:hypothetical protein
MWLGDAASDTQFVSTERLLSEHQIDFDIVDEDFLSRNVGCPTCRFYNPFGRTESGNIFHTIIIPNVAVLSDDIDKRLQDFVKTGGQVLFLGAVPKLIAGKTILDARALTPTDFTWATVVPVILPETPTPPAQPPAAPPAPMAVAADVLAALKSTVSPQDATLDTPDTAIRMMHRKLKDAEVYLFFNESAAPVSHTVSFAAKPHRIEVWDPVTGAAIPLPASDKAPLQLKPYETRVLVVR